MLANYYVASKNPLLAACSVAGASRFLRLQKAAQSGASCAPIDRRFILKPFSRASNAARADVVSYLWKIHESIGETLPDIDDTMDCDDAEIGRLKDKALYKLDGYAAELAKQPSQPDLSAAPPELEAAGPHGKGVRKPRKRKHGVTIIPEIVAAQRQASDVRWLPPGSMMQYYLQYKIQSAVTPPASFPTFWRVSSLTHFMISFVLSRILAGARTAQQVL